MPSLGRRARNALLVVGLIASGVAVHAYRERRRFEIVVSDGKPVDVRELASVPLRNLASGEQAHLTPDGRYRLVVFLSTADCSSCLFETSEWNRLAQSHPNVAVTAVVVRSSPEEAAQYVRSFRPAFPVYLDSAGLLPERVHVPEKTPFKVLLGPGGHPVAAAESSTDDSAFVGQVMKIVGKRS